MDWLCYGSVLSGASCAEEKETAFTRRDGHCVGDGDALPRGREGGRGRRDAGMQGERRGPDRPTDNMKCRGIHNNNTNTNNNNKNDTNHYNYKSRELLFFTLILMEFLMHCGVHGQCKFDPECAIKGIDDDQN